MEEIDGEGEFVSIRGRTAAGTKREIVSAEEGIVSAKGKGGEFGVSEVEMGKIEWTI